MADDQVKYSELVYDDGALDVLKKRLDDIKKKMAEVKAEAAALSGETSRLGTATRQQQQAVSDNATATENLRRRMRDLSDEEQKLEAIRKRYKKLTDQEIASVEALRQALAGEAKEQIAAVQAIDIQSKSYNELYQTYNALKDALNQMTTAERQNSEAGKEMVNRAKEIRDTLNNLQQATGNYTLNVGNYMSAMNGLQFQTQQVLREIPSAQNLSQFFLAISNNIPMFADALARYNKGLPEIRVKLAAVTAEIAKQQAEMAGLNVQSTEYAAKQAQLNELQRQQQQLQSVNVSGWSAVLKAVGSWQTLLIAGLLLLRKLPEIIKKIKTAFDNVSRSVNNVYNSLVRMRQVMNEIDANVESNISNTVVELTELNNRLANVTQGSEEWKNITSRINEIMGDNYDLANKMPGQIQQITKAYIAQAEQLAKNKFVIDKISENAENSFKRQQIIESVLKGDVESAAKRLGFEKDSDQYKELVNTANTSMPLPSMTDPNEKIWEVVDGMPRRVGYDKFMTELMNDFLDKQLGPLFSDKELDKLWNKYYKPMREKVNKATDNTPKPSGSFNNSYNAVTEGDLLVEEANAMRDKGDTALQTIQMWYDKRVAITNAAYVKEKETLERERDERNKSLTDNLNNAIQFKSKYEALVAEVDKDPFLDEEGKAARKAELKDQYDEAIKLIESAEKQREDIKEYYDQKEKIAEQKKNNELADLDQQRTEKLFKEEEKRFKAKQDAAKRQFDLEKHNSIERAKFDMEQTIASKQWQIDHAKELQLSKEELAILKEEVAWLQKKYNQGNYNAKGGNTGNYSNVVDLLFGEKLTGDQQSALSSVFDQAKEALNSWMDARKAAADQAKELADDEVSAAENALNREIELRNQGYANNVALRERELADAKRNQEKAIEEQNKVAKQQILLDAAMQTSSMITASANILKQFAANPVLAATLLATMWGTFAYAKVQAYKASEKTVQFREGGVMMLEGGSHASGHDVGLGIGPDGSNLRAEGGEYFAVINKRSSRRYGSEIPGIVNALNSGVFEDKYIKTSDAVGLPGSMGSTGNAGDGVDLSAVESGVSQLVRQGERTYSVEGEWRVMRYKNLTRRVRVS